MTTIAIIAGIALILVLLSWLKGVKIILDIILFPPVFFAFYLINIIVGGMQASTFYIVLILCLCWEVYKTVNNTKDKKSAVWELLLSIASLIFFVVMLLNNGGSVLLAITICSLADVGFGVYISWSIIQRDITLGSNGGQNQ